ncbi:AAA family ATPase [Corynebacterium phoceense]|uniref:AAA family ATPase n=2 Tax=Bacillati TaxID=1783272 RepID=A0A540R7Z5_9CORY|nr:RNA-binding domain-containing protein [Corynebacterium phoceense]TQE43865.1 AAA family ATPase [Corynebacterium phoceense]
MKEDELNAIMEALRAIYDGATGDSQESPTLDFKEDPAVHAQARNPDAHLIEFLIDETICFSNADGGTAYIVLGVSDKKSGPSAFTGTHRDITWLETKIFDGTRPNIRVEGEALDFNGVRLIALRVPAGITLYHRPKGQASIRVGTSCEPLTEAQRHKIYLDRANPDFSAAPSLRTMSELDPTAIDQALHLLAQKRTSQGREEPGPRTASELLIDLALLTDDGTPTFAAEILFMKPPHGRVTVRHLLRTTPSGEPTTTELSAPLVTTYLRLKDLVALNAAREVARVDLSNGQEVAIPAFPERAVDELISNALAHRDWDAAAAVVVDQSPISFTVWSPGGFPVGVTTERVLTTQSVPRNPRLMNALRMLGLTEESSRGFDRMWISMLGTGRRVPTVHAEENFVEVTLSSGSVDAAFIHALVALRERFDAEAFTSVNGLLLARHFMDNKILLLHTAAKLLQLGEPQTLDNLEWYVGLGFLEPLRSAPEWVLSGAAREAMGLEDGSHITSTTVQDWIQTQLRAGASLTTREVADELGIDRHTVTDILRHLRTVGEARVDPSGPQRGPATRWIQAS